MDARNLAASEIQALVIAPSPRVRGEGMLCARHGVDAGGGSPLRALVMGIASRWATASLRGEVGRKPEAKLGADEQKPDTRPTRWGNPATDGDAQ